MSEEDTPGLRHRPGVARDQDVRDAAIKASNNVPTRTRGKARRHARPLEMFENLPDYLRDNEHIKRFYRRESTVWESVKSVFK